MLDEQAIARRGEEQHLQWCMAEMKKQWMDAYGFCQTRGIVCPYRLIGRRHRVPMLNGSRCECERLQSSNIYDHPYGFYRKGRASMLECIVTHPYQYYDHETSILESVCSALGLCYEVLPKSESWYRQGATFMVVITKDGAANPLDSSQQIERSLDNKPE